MATEKNLNGNDTVHPLATVSNRITSVLDRLPTLDDVLHRQSQPPVCLYNYYIVLRDRLEIETLLDFWLDVAQAEILYKRYAKYAARAAAANKYTGTNNTNTSTTLHAQVKPSISSSISSSPLQSPDILTQMLLVHPRASYATTMTTNTNGSKRPPPTLTEMTETIERIYLRYIVPSAEKELVQLPVQIRDTINTYFHDKASPENPAIYAQAKEYVHQLLQSTFPLFLRYKAFMNLTLAQQLGRLACGLVLLLFGFSLEFSLIFLDIRPWQKRLWGILPIGSGVFCIVTCLAGIDPIWVLCFNLSETVPFHFNSILQPRVKKILRTRSYVILAIIFFVTLIFLIFFCALAGRRL